MNKLVELKSYVDQCKPHIIGITETWCTSSIDDAEISLNDYNLYRCDRKGASGGGVLMYVHTSLHSVTCEPLAHLDIEEAVWCLATLRNHYRLLIGTVYRSPTSSHANDRKLNDALSSIENYCNCSERLIIGDFNAPSIDWNNLSCSNGSSSFAREFINSTQDSFLTQHVCEPTRHIPGQRPSILDLVFTSNPDSIDEVQHHTPLGSSDHECIFFEVKCSTQHCKQVESNCKYNYMKADYLSINNKLNEVNWDTVLCNESIDTNWEAFKNILLTISTKFTPKAVKNSTLINHHGGQPKLVEL